MKDSNGDALPTCCQAKSSRPESDTELGLISSSRDGFDPGSHGMTTKGADQKPHEQPMSSVSASSARKKASEFGGNFRFR